MGEDQMEKQDKARMTRKVLHSSLISAGILAAIPGIAAATPAPNPSFCAAVGATGYDNNNPQTIGAWTDVRRPTEINGVPDPDEVTPVDCMLELKGSAGSAGDMWITLLDPPQFPG